MIPGNARWKTIRPPSGNVGWFLFSVDRLMTRAEKRAMGPSYLKHPNPGYGRAYDWQPAIGHRYYWMSGHFRDLPARPRVRWCRPGFRPTPQFGY